MADKTPLTYERPASSIPRWQFRLLLLLVAAHLAITIQSVYVPNATATVKTWWAERQVAKQMGSLRQQAWTFTEPAGKVVWDEAPETAAALLASPDYRKISVEGVRDVEMFGEFPAGARAKLPASVIASVGDLLPDEHNRAIQPEETALLMLHGRRSPSGLERLVCIGIKGRGRLDSFPPRRPDQHKSMSFDRRLSIVAVPCEVGILGNRLRLNGQEEGISTLVIHPNWNESSTGLTPGKVHWMAPQADKPGRFRLEIPSAFRLYAGQPDPNDPSHFTIGYEVNGRRGIIHGWLKDSGAIELKPDIGALAGRRWQRSAMPQTAPAASR